MKFLFQNRLTKTTYYCPHRDGGNPSPLGEARCDVTWSRATLPTGRAHTKNDLKVHLVWIPKYRKAVLTRDVAIRVRDLLRQIAAEHELEIVSGKVTRGHVHLLISYRPNQDVSQIIQWLKGSAHGSCCRSFHIYERSSGKDTYGPEVISRSARAQSPMR